MSDPLIPLRKKVFDRVQSSYINGALGVVAASTNIPEFILVGWAAADQDYPDDADVLKLAKYWGITCDT